MLEKPQSQADKSSLRGFHWLGSNWFNLLLLLMVIALQYRLWLGEANLWQLLKLHDSIALQLTDNGQLAERNQRLLAEVEELRNGQDAIEERARMELGLIKPDETFYWIISEKPLPKDATRN